MKRVKQQLKTFYRGQGLKGKRLKRAVWADVGRAKAARMMQNGLRLTGDGAISTQFNWGASVSGHDYWRARQGWSL